MRLHNLLIVAAAAVALAPSPARADEEWYGHHVLAVDVGAVALVAGGIAVEVSPVWVGGLGVALLGGPVVHVAHGNGSRAAASLGLRGGGALVVGTIGAIIGPVVVGKGGESGAGFAVGLFGGALVGAMAGLVAGAAIDIAFVAREDDDESAPRMFSIGGSF